MNLKKELQLMKIEQINYSGNRDENLYQGLSNIFSSFKFNEFNLIYMITNISKISSLYLGVSRNYEQYNEKSEVLVHKESAKGLGKILKRKFESLFKGSKINFLDNKEIELLIKKLYDFKDETDIFYVNDYFINSKDKKYSKSYKYLDYYNDILLLRSTENIILKDNLITLDKIISSYYNKNFIILYIINKDKMSLYLISDSNSTINSIYFDLNSIFKNIDKINKKKLMTDKGFKNLLHLNPIDKEDLFEKNNLNIFSKIFGLPNNEIIGVTLKEEVSFGLNIPKKNNNNNVEFAKLLQDKLLLDISVSLNKEDLNKHIFITGVTGSGKTTTCKTLLKTMDLPYCVIEPAKTEYRELLESDKDVIVFTVGENLCNFYINPFQLQENETIDSRVGMIKGAILSSFDLDAAIPQIIETSIYKMYEELGWDLYKNEQYRFLNNEYQKVPENERTYPTFDNLLKIIPKIVEMHGFSEDMKYQYIGSLISRLSTFINGGVKKDIFGVMYGLDFSEIVKRKVVFELDNIKDSNEKSFLIAMILANINQAVKNEYKKNKNFRHITLIEEAHRFLAKEEIGNNSKYEGIRMFSDMLAEVRKYGEGLIIVDQIPSKLISEVLKNTNTKIIHKIFSKDDKEAVGNTMSLNEKQMSYLSNLDSGEAVIFSYGWNKPILAKINFDTKEEIIDDFKIEALIKEKFKKEFFIAKIRIFNMMFQILNFSDFDNKRLNRLINVEEFEKLISKDEILKLIEENSFFGLCDNIKTLSIIVKILNSIEIELINYSLNSEYKNENKNTIKQVIVKKFKELSDLNKYEINRIIDKIFSRKGYKNAEYNRK